LSPSGIIAGDVKGVIVYFDGGDGTQPLAKGSPTAGDMVTYYFEQGYELVQIAWSSAWEATYNPFPSGTFGNIQAAACRPATFLTSAMAISTSRFSRLTQPPECAPMG